MYLDANNCYGWVMSQYLPNGGFRWMTEKEINNLKVPKYQDDSKKGFILEVDLEYPKESHDLYNDYSTESWKKNESKFKYVIWLLS